MEIKKYPDPILRKKAKEIKEITPEVKELGLDMLETMKEKEGIGLAAPQVGISQRIIAVQLISERTVEEKTGKAPQILINPKIIKKSRETEIDKEGCLSFPGLWLQIKRAKKVEVRALNKDGKEVGIAAEGLPARILQHEIDHLDNILFVDRLGWLQRLKIRRRLK